MEMAQMHQRAELHTERLQMPMATTVSWVHLVAHQAIIMELLDKTQAQLEAIIRPVLAISKECKLRGARATGLFSFAQDTLNFPSSTRENR
jgi:hypothetical protein